MAHSAPLNVTLYLNGQGRHTECKMSNVKTLNASMIREKESRRCSRLM